MIHLNIWKALRVIRNNVAERDRMYCLPARVDLQQANKYLNKYLQVVFLQVVNPHKYKLDMS